MGASKALLRLANGRSMVETAATTLGQVTPRVVLVGDPQLIIHPFDLIPDQDFRGPLWAIHRAMESINAAAFLVVPCDMPLLTAKTLGHVASQDGTACYIDPRTNSPLPLPLKIDHEVKDTLWMLVRQGIRSIREFLEVAEPTVLALPEQAHRELLNVNTPEDFEALRKLPAPR